MSPSGLGSVEKDGENSELGDCTTFSMVRYQSFRKWGVFRSIFRVSARSISGRQAEHGVSMLLYVITSLSQIKELRFRLIKNRGKHSSGFVPRPIPSSTAKTQIKGLNFRPNLRYFLVLPLLGYASVLGSVYHSHENF